MAGRVEAASTSAASRPTLEGMLWYGHNGSWIFVVIILALFAARMAARRRGPGPRQGPGPYGGGPFGGGPFGGGPFGGGQYGRGPYGGPGRPTGPPSTASLTSTGPMATRPAPRQPTSTESPPAGPGGTDAAAPPRGSGSGGASGNGSTAAANGHTGIPAGWLVDPSGKHQQRYWSGTAWTEHVADDGVPGLDPPPGSTTGSGPATS